MPKDIKIAHFIHDEKFPDSAYDQFEAVVPGSSDYFIVSKAKELQHVKKIPVNFIDELSFNDEKFLRQLTNYDIIILHSLSKLNQCLVANLKTTAPIVWIGMGIDYYSLIYESRQCLYFDKTYEVEKKRMSFPNKIKRKLKTIRNNNGKIDFIEFIKKTIAPKKNNKNEIINKIDYFAPVLKEEYKIIKNKQENFIPKFIEWNYSKNASLFDGRNAMPAISGNNILLGNSAALTNNHIEAIDLLKYIGVNDRKVVCPLSYGNAENAKTVDEYGKKELGGAFVSVMDFMPYEQYIRMISTCSNVIMNHLRQQAGGNISAMLFMGAKVFLNKENPLYSHYMNLGIKVYLIDDLKENPKLLDKKIPQDEVNHVQKILREKLGWEAALKKTRNLIDTALNSYLN